MNVRTTDDVNPIAVYRINHVVTAGSRLDAFSEDDSLGAETSSLAAMPSIQMAVTFLGVLAWRGRRRWEKLAAAYCAVMSLSLVYLGEHHVIDEVEGIAMVLFAWRVATSVLGWVQAKEGGRLTEAWSEMTVAAASGSRRLRLGKQYSRGRRWPPDRLGTLGRHRNTIEGARTWRRRMAR